MSSTEETANEGRHENDEENESETSKTASESISEMKDAEIKPVIIPDKPLTREIAASCLSLLSRLGYGFSHAFIKFNCVNKLVQ
ncbi:unnamed protein product, partial [Hymenolepis diminuta]